MSDTSFEEQVEIKIKSILQDLDGLEEIATWMRGAVPEQQISEDDFPLARIMIGPVREGNHSLTHWEWIYDGLLSFSVSQTTMGIMPDNLESRDGEINPESYAAVRRWKSAARSELLRAKYLDLDDFAAVNEVVCSFSITEQSSGAAYQAERQNNWSNVSNLQFSIRTQEPRQA